MFSKKLADKLDEYHLLKHPFYQAWNEGKLNREIIKDYAEQYYQHVKAFQDISVQHILYVKIFQKEKCFWKIYKKKKIETMITLNFETVCNGVGS